MASRQLNFQIDVEDYEWLREHAHRTRRPQAVVLREALAEYRRRADPPSPPRSLTQLIEDGALDLEILRNHDDYMSHHELP